MMVTAPSTAGSTSYMLTCTNDKGTSTAGTATLTATAPAATQSPSSGGGGGGGGTLDDAVLLMLGAAGLGRLASAVRDAIRDR